MRACDFIYRRRAEDQDFLGRTVSVFWCFVFLFYFKNEKTPCCREKITALLDLKWVFIVVSNSFLMCLITLTSNLYIHMCTLCKFMEKIWIYWTSHWSKVKLLHVVQILSKASRLKNPGQWQNQPGVLLFLHHLLLLNNNKKDGGSSNIIVSACVNHWEKLSSPIGPC